MCVFVCFFVFRLGAPHCAPSSAKMAGCLANSSMIAFASALPRSVTNAQRAVPPPRVAMSCLGRA